MRRFFFPYVCAAAAFAAFGPPAAAQQATDMPAAVQPGKGLWAVRQIAHYVNYDDGNTGRNRGDIDELTYQTTLAYGFARDWVAMLHLPVRYRSFSGEGLASGPLATDADDQFGLDDPTLMIQHRVWKSDEGPVGTQRLVLLGGAEFGFGGDVASENFEPLLGVAYTRVRGRHGLNASAVYQFGDEADDQPVRFGDLGEDALRLDGSYLYRLSPEAYAADTAWSSYLQAQVLGRYEANGDVEVVFAPGYLYEARRWAAELTVHLPVLQELDDRPEHRWGLTAGLRLLY